MRGSSKRDLGQRKFTSISMTIRTLEQLWTYPSHSRMSLHHFPGIIYAPSGAYQVPIEKLTPAISQSNESDWPTASSHPIARMKRQIRVHMIMNLHPLCSIVVNKTGTG